MAGTEFVKMTDVRYTYPLSDHPALDHLDLCARVTVFGQELSAAGIRLQWNNLHQDEQPILPTPGIAPEI